MITIRNDVGDVKAISFQSELLVSETLNAAGYADSDDFGDLLGIEILGFKEQLPNVTPYVSREDRYAASFDPEVDAWSSGRIGGGVARTEPATLTVLVKDGVMIEVRVARL